MCWCLQLLNVGDDVLLFYNDKASFAVLIDLMRSERHRLDPNSPLQYHINLVQLLACCTEGKNVYTEIKCHSLLPLDDIVRVVSHPDCIPEVSAQERAVVTNALVAVVTYCVFSRTVGAGNA